MGEWLPPGEITNKDINMQSLVPIHHSINIHARTNGSKHNQITLF